MPRLNRIGPAHAQLHKSSTKPKNKAPSCRQIFDPYSRPRSPFASKRLLLHHPSCLESKLS